MENYTFPRRTKDRQDSGPMLDSSGQSPEQLFLSSEWRCGVPLILPRSTKALTPPAARGSACLTAHSRVSLGLAFGQMELPYPRLSHYLVRATFNDRVMKVWPSGPNSGCSEGPPTPTLAPELTEAFVTTALLFNFSLCPSCFSAPALNP